MGSGRRNRKSNRLRSDGILKMNSVPVFARLCVRVCVNYDGASLHDRER